MSLGWAFRGFIGGGPLGAMIPGAMVSLALLWLLAHHQPAFARPPAGLVVAFGAVGIGFGGQMTYGQTVGLASDPSAMAWGLLGLALKGAVWGLLGGATLGLAFTLHRYSPSRIMVAIGAMLVATWAGWWFVNRPKLIYFSNPVDRPREEVWMGLLAGALAMLAVLLWRTSNSALLRFAWASFLGGGLGFGLGGVLLAAGRNSGLDNTFWPWWKGMEYTFGLLFGLALGWAALRSREELAGMWGALLPKRGLLGEIFSKQEPSSSSPASRADRTPIRSWQARGVLVWIAAALLIAGAVWFEYAVDLRFAYSVAGAALLAVVLFSESLAWQIAITMTGFAFLLDLAEAFSGDLAFGSAALGMSVAVAASFAIGATVQSIQTRETAVLPRMFWLLVLASFGVTTLKTAMQMVRSPGPHLEYWMFVAAMLLVWWLSARLRTVLPVPKRVSPGTVGI